jgi:2-polyprenyl-3-methyl-5-hydroxy-6-metoxy-1,4-benzoquinol methylase
MTDINAKIWDSLYATGNYLRYPSEVLVQLYFRCIGNEKMQGDWLDHGSGSGNNSEFLARQGWNVTCSDISPNALDICKRRLLDVGADHSFLKVDGERPLGKQIGQYENIISWDCLCYNRRSKCIADCADLVSALKTGGHIFVNMPTMKHDFATSGLRLPDGSYENRRHGTRQAGAIMTIPESLSELISWFGDLEIIESGHFCFDFAGYREFMFIAGRRTG